MTLLTRFEAENYCKITAVALDLREGVTEITGSNAQGKTAVINGIYALLRGKSVLPPEPIRDGAERIRLRGEFGEYVVEREFWTTKSGELTGKLTITRGDERCQSTEGFLKGLIGEHMLDPNDFLRADKRKQYDMLKALVPGFDFDKAAADHKTDELQRRDIGRDGEKLAAAASMIDVPPGTPDQVPDEAALVQQLEDAGRANAERAQRAARRQQAEKDIPTWRSQAEGLEDQAAELIKRAEALRKQADDTEAALKAAGPLPDEINTDLLRGQIDKARQTRTHVEAKARKAALVAQVKDHQERYDALTRRMDARELAKRDAIAAANLPIPGLSFGDGEILLNGKPFVQASTAEGIKTGVALAVCRNPELRLVWIRDASLLDDESIAYVERLAKQMKVQVILETVRPLSRDAIEIVDGALAA